ncbi:MAG: hypothetical protein QN174_06345 [Armatimonadota bacterium]|nr:hypothetical protein [Armatimonadota bacterium]MDR7422527.1 hypothetical protein [Armatimonadota bacterium]MDR7455249.1 hypothetical protein [Armatimonadota bacterium]MDR7457450.1 hypothetical protein [Armatimonadota bacterium]MDR7496559.1 hypothetical protein [Armatimonadota bacterium]
MDARALVGVFVAGVLVAGNSLPGAAAPADPVKTVLERLRQADALVATVVEAARTRDLTALRARIEEYRALMRTVAAEAKHLPADNPGTQRALEIVREATLKHMDSLKKAQEQVTSEQARAALDRAMEVSQIGHNVSTEALEQINAGTPGPPAGVPNAGANAGGGRGGR